MSDKDNKPYLAPFSSSVGLRIIPAPNGGYIVYAGSSDHGIVPEMLGAFGCAADMIEALEDSLVKETEAEK